MMASPPHPRIYVFPGRYESESQPLVFDFEVANPACLGNPHLDCQPHPRFAWLSGPSDLYYATSHTLRVYKGDNDIGAEVPGEVEYDIGGGVVILLPNTYWHNDLIESMGGFLRLTESALMDLGGGHGASVQNTYISERAQLAAFADMNGDGLPDRVAASFTGAWRVWFNTGSGFHATPTMWQSGFAPEDFPQMLNVLLFSLNDGSRETQQNEAQLIDINGDGLPDHMIRERNWWCDPVVRTVDCDIGEHPTNPSWVGVEAPYNAVTRVAVNGCVYDPVHGCAPGTAYFAPYQELDVEGYTPTTQFAGPNGAWVDVNGDGLADKFSSDSNPYYDDVLDMCGDGSAMHYYGGVTFNAGPDQFDFDAQYGDDCDSPVEILSANYVESDMPMMTGEHDYPNCVGMTVQQCMNDEHGRFRDAAVPEFNADNGNVACLDGQNNPGINPYVPVPHTSDIQWLDVNGDGVMDRAGLDNVQYGLGDGHFLPPIAWSMPNPDYSALSAEDSKLSDLLANFDGTRVSLSSESQSAKHMEIFQGKLREVGFLTLGADGPGIVSGYTQCPDPTTAVLDERMSLFSAMHNPTVQRHAGHQR